MDKKREAINRRRARQTLLEARRQAQRRIRGALPRGCVERVCDSVENDRNVSRYHREGFRKQATSHPWACAVLMGARSIYERKAGIRV